MFILITVFQQFQLIVLFQGTDGIPGTEVFPRL